jgi:hypothetical protein
MRPSFLAIASLLPIAFVTADDCNANNVPYTGYSLKSGSGCTEYVNCVSGVIVETLPCPSGTLYNGAVGVAGVCAWEDTVECLDVSSGGIVLPTGVETIGNETGVGVMEVEGNITSSIGMDDVIGGTVESNVTSDGNSTVTNVMSTIGADYEGVNTEVSNITSIDLGSNVEDNITMSDTETTTVPTQEESNATTSTDTETFEAENATVNPSTDNPNNYYCGPTDQEAAELCLPCPTGDLSECADPSHGCFVGVTTCATSPTVSSTGTNRGYATDLSSRITITIQMEKNFDHGVECSLGDWGLCYTKTVVIDYLGDADYTNT